MRVLDKQVNIYKNDVEVLVDVDGGRQKIGAKRNVLLCRASGKYVAFIDDDDLVTDSYVKNILLGLESDVDCCGMEGIITTNGRDPRKFIHSIRYGKWFESNGIYYRSPNHLNPVKRELALKVKFPCINRGEDFDYSKRLFRLLKTEQYIKEPIYKYLFVSRKR